MYKRDCFELGAYLDSEVTASEQRQIEDWVTTDPGAQSLYARVLQLCQQRQRMPMPAAHSPVSGTAGQVLPRWNNPLSRRWLLPHNRWLTLGHNAGLKYPETGDSLITLTGSKKLVSVLCVVRKYFRQLLLPLSSKACLAARLSSGFHCL